MIFLHEVPLLLLFYLLILRLQQLYMIDYVKFGSFDK